MRMPYLFRACVAASCVSVAALFVFSNTVLSLPAGPPHRCIVLFDLPFTDKRFVLPMWMSQLSMDLAAISTLMAVLLWVMLLIKRWRIRDVQS
jgi:hypothetical protein